MPGIDEYVVCMLHFNGADGSTTFTDSSDSAHSFTVEGSSQLDTAQYKWTSSGLFDSATSDYIYALPSSDWNFGGDPWTIDCWVRTPEDQNNRCPMCIGGQHIGFWQMTSYKIGFDTFDDLGTRYYDFSSSITQNAWTHLALVRDGVNLYFFVGGTKLITKNVGANTFDKSAYALYVGGPGTYFSKGWVEELRVSKGVARWTADFTPPTYEYSPASSITEAVGLGETFTVSEPKTITEGVALGETFTVSEPQTITEGVGLDDAFTSQMFQSTITEGVGLDDTFSPRDNPSPLTEAVALDETFTPQMLQKTITEGVGLDETLTPQMLQKTITEAVALGETITPQMLQYTLTEQAGVNDSWKAELVNRVRRKRVPIIAKGQRISFKFENSTADNGLYLIDVKYKIYQISRPNKWNKISAIGNYITLKYQNNTVSEGLVLEDVMIKSRIIEGR